MIKAIPPPEKGKKKGKKKGGGGKKKKKWRLNSYGGSYITCFITNRRSKTFGIGFSSLVLKMLSQRFEQWHAMRWTMRRYRTYIRYFIYSVYCRYKWKIS